MGGCGTLLAIGVLLLAFNIKPAKGAWTGTVYIRADGSIYPLDAPIMTYDNLTYTLTETLRVLTMESLSKGITSSLMVQATPSKVLDLSGAE